MFSILNPPPSSLPIPSLWVVLVHQPQASSITHRTWIGDLFPIWYYTCFNAILPNHPTLSLSHRVQKTFGIFLNFKVLYCSFNFHFYNLLFLYPCRKRPYFYSTLHIYIYLILWLWFVFLISYFWESNLYSRFLIFAFWYFLSICIFKNPIVSTHFYLEVRFLAWLLSPPFDSAFSPPGRLYLPSPPSLLYPTLWISLCVLDCGEQLGNWLLAGSVSLLFIPHFRLLATSVSFLPLLLSV